MNIVILALPGCQASAVSGLQDIFWLMQQNLPEDSSSASLNTRIASIDGDQVMDGHGRPVSVDLALKDVSTCAAIIIPGFLPQGNQPPPDITDKSVIALLRQYHSRGSLICGSCSGVFVLGQAGLLNERRCTTTWWLSDPLKRLYPRADITWSEGLTDDRRVVTAAGPLSWIDLALHIVRILCGPETAKRAAGIAVVDSIPLAQSIRIPTGTLSPSDPFLAKAEEIIRNAGRRRLTAQGLAENLSISERRLQRKMKQACGNSASHFINLVRFETARVALETSDHPVWQIATDVGFSTETSFQRNFQRQAGMSPKAYRNWAKVRNQ